MLVTPFSKNCFVFAVLAASLMSSRVAAQELSSPISPPLLIAKVDEPSVGDIPTLDFSVSLDLPTDIPFSGISSFSPWLRNSQLLARADLLYWRSLSLFRNQHFRLLNSQDSGTNLLAESVSPVGVDLSVLSAIASDSLVVQAIAETEEVISDSVPVTEVSQTNGANPEDVMPGIPTETPVPDAEIPAPPETPAVPPTPEELDKQIEDLQKRLQVLGDNIPEFIWLSSPGTSFYVPTAFGASLGEVGFGVGFVNRNRFNQTADGGAGITFGLGDPYNAVGFDVGIVLNDLGISGSESFGGRGGFEFKLHRVLPEDFRIAVAVESVLVWGGTDADTTIYGVVSKTFRLKKSKFEPFSRLYLNVGVGSGSFRTEDQINNNTGSVGVFGSVAVRVIDQMNIFTEWTGQNLNVGLSIAPFSEIPIIITPAALDITGSAGDGVRFGLGISYGFRF